MELKALYFPLFVLWIPALLLYLLRGGGGLLWKLSVLLVSLFYGIWFQPEIMASALLFRDSTDRAVVEFLSSFMDLTGLLLMLLWPLVLLVGYYAASPLLHRKMVRSFVILTLFYWLFWFAGFYLGDQPARWIKSILPSRIQLSWPDVSSSARSSGNKR